MPRNRTLLMIVGLLAVVAVVVCAVAALLFFNQLSTPTSPEPTVVVDDSLARIQAAGKIVVGTSADYPPFEYYLSDFQLDGFDIALTNEIARRLGVTPEYHNFAFDGLGNALQVNQIDLAVAAISVTPERAALVDFSNVYFVTEDAILASDQVQVAVNRAQDLAGYRIGVQSASVHARWAQTNLVEPGLIEPGDFLVYQQIDQAVNDLQAGRLDFVIMDLPPAQVAVNAGGATIAGQGLNPQRFALALRKGSTSLTDEINRILADLYSEGKIAELAQQYLALEPDEILPTPTPGTLPTVVPTPVVCIDSLALVEHLTLNDNNMSAPPELQPGQSFSKSWRVRNSGTCTWDSNYRLGYIHGSDPAAGMGGQPVVVTRPVQPDETYDIQVDLVAPLKPGTYQGFWQMLNGYNVAFGERLAVGIKVPALPTATPAPTQTPAPGIDFTVDRTNIKAGECVVFSWEIENVREVYFYAQGERWQDKGVTGQESRTVCPAATTTYELRVVTREGAVEIRQITIYVEPVINAPTIARFTVDPEPQIVVGQCVDIRWEVQGQISQVMIRANNVALWDGAPTSGSLQNCPPGTGKVEYTLVAQGPGGSSQKVRTINVVVSPTATPVPPTATPVPPTATFEPATPTPLPPTSTPTPLPPTPTPEAPPENPLAGTSWLLQDTMEGTNISASFGADGSLNGSAGCNSYSAQYIADGQTLAITPPSSSQIICAEPEGIMDQETTYLTNLPLAATFQISDTTLIIADNAGQPMMRFNQLMAVPLSE